MRRNLNKAKTAILSNAPIREEVASLSSSPYYEQKSHWLERLKAVLTKAGLMTYIEPDMLGDKGYCHIPLVEIDGGEYPPTVGYIYVSWYRMPSFNWEIINYIT